MDLGLYWTFFVILHLTVVLGAELKYFKQCKFEYRCGYWYGCDPYSLYCYNDMIECDEWTTINILVVKYGTLQNTYYSKYCPNECFSSLSYSHADTKRLKTFCNEKRVCYLSQWNTDTYWNLYVIYDCQERTTSPNTSINWKSTTQTTTFFNNTESEKDKNNSPDQFPVLIVAASITAGIIVLVIVVIVVVCIKRRKGTIKSNQPDQTTLQMQIVANNSYVFSPPSVNMEDQHDTDEHVYVDISLQNAYHAANSTSEQKYVYFNADKILNKDNNDEYNTFNTHPAPYKMDPNYDHIPKGSHTTVDETYSHITDGQTAMPDATYSHLKDIKSTASRNAKSNQNNSDNVYNHINTKSVEENVYNNSQTSFNRSSSSHLGETIAVEDDYDHTDWKPTIASSSKSKNSNNEAVGKFETKNITERARDEYAVVKKRSGKVERSDGHNYFILEKQFF